MLINEALSLKGCSNNMFCERLERSYFPNQEDIPNGVAFKLGDYLLSLSIQVEYSPWRKKKGIEKIVETK